MKDLKVLRRRHLKTGYAISLFLVLLAFEWTIQRVPLAEVQPEDIYDAELEIRRTVQKKEEKKEIPKPDVKNAVIVESDKPVLIDSFIEAFEPEEVISGPVSVKPGKKFVPDPPPRPEEPETEGPLIIAEDMPRFAGCDGADMSREEKKRCTDERLTAYLYNHLQYPAAARENGVEGMVVVRFVVEKDGSISEATVVRDIGFGCGREALRVVSDMPEWVPGRQRGRAVRVLFTLPVKFRLE